MRHPMKTVLVTGAALAAASAPALAQCDSSKLMAQDRASGDAFAGALSMSQIPAGNAPSMLVGARFDDTAAGSSAGSVYVFHRGLNGWHQSEQVFASDGAAFDYFGTAVGYDYPWLCIGAPGAADSGAAYVYTWVSGFGWWPFPRLTPPNAQPGDGVGQAVDITEDNGVWAVVGAPFKDLDLDAGAGASDPNAGQVHFYRFVSGQGMQHMQTVPLRLTLGNPGGAWANDQYGAAVAIAGEVAVCGAPLGEFNGTTDHGFADIYRLGDNNTWVLSATLVGPVSAADDRFGSAVATDGVSVALGAPYDDLAAGEMHSATAKLNSGCVAIYRWVNNAWALDGRVFAGDPSDNARFGASVAVEGDSLIVAAPGVKRAYAFRRLAANNWVQFGVYADPDLDSNGTFGGAVGIAGGDFAASDAGDDDTANGLNLVNQGAAYAFAAPQAGVGADSCLLATPIPGAGVYTGCTEIATLDGASTCLAGFNGYGPDVWYAWTPPCSGSITIDTLGSDFDTVLSVHSGCPGNAATTLVCNDDGGAALGSASLVTVNHVAGQTYLIRISGYSRAAGNYTLRIIDGYVPPNDACATALNVGNGTYSFTSCAAGNNLYLGASCASGADIQKDLWFRYTAACTGPIEISTCGSTFDTMVEVYAGAACPTIDTPRLACADDGPSGSCPDNADATALTFQAVAGVAYSIRVGGRASGLNTLAESGDGVLTISCNVCPADWNHSGTVSVQDIFDFLASYFAGSADFNASGATSVQDIFDFLAAYFAGC